MYFPDTQKTSYIDSVKEKTDPVVCSHSKKMDKILSKAILNHE